MAPALQIVQAGVSLSFLALGVYTVVDWLRHRERSRGYLALALGTLGLTSVAGQVNALTGYHLAPVGDLALVLFMVSGYALLLFRDSFIPLSRGLRVGALVLTAAATVFALVVTVPSDPHQRPTGLQSVATLVLVLVWSACVIEPIVRFWIASQHRPAVQRARLRAIAGGYGAIVVILLVAGFGGAAATNPVVQWLFEAVAVMALPLLYVSFAAPRWLRRLWRQGEEDQYREAVHELVLFSPDRPTLARRAAEWGLRLVGAEGIAIVDANGELLALRGLRDDAAHRLAAQVDPKSHQPRLLATAGSSREDAIVVPLPLDLGMGAMVVVSGPYTPFFGTDEVSRLRGYAANITAALDRARVTERLASLEKTKTQFLNLASHELRSPLGVINGYLSMLEQGSLGQLTEPGLRAMEVLKAKTAELNLLVAQMLDAARLEDGRLALKRDRLDLREVAAEAMQVVRPLAGPDHVLTLEAPPAAVTVMADADRIKTIISNLLENAIKYSPSGGRIQCIVSMADRVATLRVVDSGVGIAREDLPRLFNRFERIENRETSHVGGTGLGLYLSRELARQHGGEIQAESHPQSGSTFTLTLPLSVAAPQLTEPVQSEPEPVAPRLHVVSADADADSESRLG